MLHPKFGANITAPSISHRTNFRRAAGRFWLVTQVPRMAKKVFPLVLSKESASVSSSKFLFVTIAEVAMEILFEVPLEVGKTNGPHAAFKFPFSEQRTLQGQ